jgi:hypothetical protein
VSRKVETSEKYSIDRSDCSGVSAERRKLHEIEECGFLPKAATPVLQRSQVVVPKFSHRPLVGQFDFTKRYKITVTQAASEIFNLAL